MSRVRVLHLTRGISSNSMPWNDLYRIGRRLAPGIMYPPLAITLTLTRAVIRWEDCGEERRRYTTAGPFSALSLIRTLYARQRRRGYVLALHVHSPVLGFIALAAKLICPKLKVVMNLHNDWRFFRPHQRFGLALLARISDHLIAVSTAIIQTIPLRVRNGLSKRRRLITAIPNGIESSKMEVYGWPKKRPATAVVVARMVPQKNCLFLVRLLSQTPSIERLVWYGDGYERQQVEQEIALLDIGARIELCGRRPREEVFHALASSSLYIAVSKWEGIGVANLEAAALGCQPFLSAIPPHDEIADVLGISTFQLDNVDVWTEAINEFLALGLEAQEQGRQSIADKARRSFDLEVTVSRYIEIYDGLLRDSTS